MVEGFADNVDGPISGIGGILERLPENAAVQ